MSNPSSPRETAVARYEVYGDAASVLHWVSAPLPEPGPGEVLVALECAVIHPSDFGMIAGTYGRPPPAPAVAGREGVGRVEALGPGVSGPRVGDRVRMPPDAGVWRERGVFPAGDLLVVPGDLAPEAAAREFRQSARPPCAR